MSLSIVSVVQLSLQSKRKEILGNKSKSIQTILKPLIKRRELNFKNLFKASRHQLARQTFVNYLKEATQKNSKPRETRQKSLLSS